MNRNLARKQFFFFFFYTPSSFRMWPIMTLHNFLFLLYFLIFSFLRLYIFVALLLFISYLFILSFTSISAIYLHLDLVSLQYILWVSSSSSILSSLYDLEISTLYNSKCKYPFCFYHPLKFGTWRILQFSFVQFSFGAQLLRPCDWLS